MVSYRKVQPGEEGEGRGGSGRGKEEGEGREGSGRGREEGEGRGGSGRGREKEGGGEQHYKSLKIRCD